MFYVCAKSQSGMKNLGFQAESKTKDILDSTKPAGCIIYLHVTFTVVVEVHSFWLCIIRIKCFGSKLRNEFFRFNKEIRSGLIEVVVPPKEFYPDLNNLPKDMTFHDPPLRVK